MLYSVPPRLLLQDTILRPYSLEFQWSSWATVPNTLSLVNQWVTLCSLPHSQKIPGQLTLSDLVYRGSQETVNRSCPPFCILQSSQCISTCSPSILEVDRQLTLNIMTHRGHRNQMCTHSCPWEAATGHLALSQVGPWRLWVIICAVLGQAWVLFLLYWYEWPPCGPQTLTGTLPLY